MEDPTTFDLNTAISRWRADLATSAAVQNETIDELECHLRDSMVVFESKGLSAEEAFWLAKQRLGTNASLAQEFDKVNSEQVWLSRAIWMVAGSLLIKSLLSLAAAAADLATSSVLHLTKICHDWGIFNDLIPAAAGMHSLGILNFITYCFAVVGPLVWIWRSLPGSNGLARRVVEWLRRRPISSSMAIGLALLFVNTIEIGSRLLAQRVMPPPRPDTVLAPNFYTVMHWHGFAVLLVSLLVGPLLVGWLLARGSTKSPQNMPRITG